MGAHTQLPPGVPTPPAIPQRASCKLCGAKLHGPIEPQLWAMMSQHMNRHSKEIKAMGGLNQIFYGLLLRRYFEIQQNVTQRAAVKAMRVQMAEIIEGNRIDLDHESMNKMAIAFEQEMADLEKNSKTGA